MAGNVPKMWRPRGTSFFGRREGLDRTLQPKMRNKLWTSWSSWGSLELAGGRSGSRRPVIALGCLFSGRALFRDFPAIMGFEGGRAWSGMDREARDSRRWSRIGWTWQEYSPGGGQILRNSKTGSLFSSSLAPASSPALWQCVDF